MSKYKSDEILHEALQLLERYYSTEENLFEKAIQTQVSFSISLPPQLVNPLYQKLLITKASVKVFNEVTFTHLPDLRRLAEIDVDETQCQNLLDILETLKMYIIIITYS